MRTLTIVSAILVLAVITGLSQDKWRPVPQQDPAQEMRFAEIRAQYPVTTTYSDDGLSAHGKVLPASLYSDGYADGCLAGVGGPQLKRQLDAEYSKGWKAGKRSCKAEYDRVLREVTE